MLSPNSVDRLLEGMAQALEEAVSPHIQNRFALMQCRAMVVLLRNLAGRVEWRCSDLVEENQHIRHALETLERAGWYHRHGEDPDRNRSGSSGTISPADEQCILLNHLAEGIRWLEDQETDEASLREARDELRSFLFDTFVADVALLRTGASR